MNPRELCASLELPRNCKPTHRIKHRPDEKERSNFVRKVEELVHL